MIAIDTETLPFGAGRCAPPIVCLSWSNGRAAEVVHHTSALSTIEAFLSAPIVGHNIAYDIGVIASEWPHLWPAIFKAYDEDRVTDTGVRQKLLDIRDGCRTWVEEGDVVRKATYGLDSLAQRHLGRALAKGQGIQMSFASLRDVPITQWPALSVEYSRDDAIATHAIWTVQEGRAAELADQYRQTRAALFLGLCRAWGLTTDPVAVEALKRRVEREVEECSAELRAHGLVRSNGSRNTHAAQERILAAYTARSAACPLTAGGLPQLDRDACESSGDPVLVRYAGLSRLKSTLSKDIPMLSIGLIHSRFEELVETGRTASSTPNVQNLPRYGGVRECFVPRPGCAYVIADYTGLELSTFAQVCTTLLGRSALADMIRRGEDPHMRMAERILDRPYEELRAVYKAHGEGYDVVYRARQTGKVANFGFPGGLGATRLVHFAKQSYQVDLSEAQARRLKELYLATFPEAADYFTYTDEHGGTVEQLFSGRVRNGCSFTEACNSRFQGLGADLAKHAGYAVAREQYLGRMVARTVNFVHDEIVAETPLPYVHDTAERIGVCMADAAKLWLPDVPCGVEIMASTVYSKNAKRVTDASGRLIPWSMS